LPVLKDKNEVIAFDAITKSENIIIIIIIATIAN
jgi:hypothetical protein